MEAKNLRIRIAAFNAGIPLWKLANLLGVADATLSRYLRYELSEATQMKIIDFISSKDMKKRQDVINSIRAEVCREPAKAWRKNVCKDYDPLSAQRETMSERDYERLFLET